MPLPLERQIAGHRGGSARALGGHDGENLGGFLAAAFAGGLHPRQLGHSGLELVGGEGLDQKIEGAGAQAAQNQVRIVAVEQRQDLHARTQPGHLAQQLHGLVS